MVQLPLQLCRELPVLLCLARVSLPLTEASSTATSERVCARAQGRVTKCRRALSGVQMLCKSHFQREAFPPKFCSEFP